MQFKNLNLPLFLLLLFISPHAASAKPEWCGESSLNETEATICSDASLWQFDKELVSAFESAVGISKTSQLDWLSKRNACGQSSSCIKNQYVERIAFLKSRSSFQSSSEELEKQRLQKRFSDTTTFGYLVSNYKSWNAFFASDGTATYWSSSSRIRRGKWFVQDNQICVRLREVDCRVPRTRADGMTDWIDPKTGNATSILVRFERGDVLGLSKLRPGSTHRPLTSFVGTTGSRSSDVQWLQTHSFRDITEANDHAKAFIRDGFVYSVVATTRNGWYAVSVGQLKKNESELMDRWKRLGRIPSDSILTKGESYLRVTAPQAAGNPSFPPKGAQCTAKKYSELRDACHLVFAAETACNLTLSNDGDLNEFLERSAGAGFACSIAAQLLIDNNIDPIALMLSTGAGLLDDAAEDARSDRSATGEFTALILEALKLGTMASGVAYCYGEVDRKCGR